MNMKPTQFRLFFFSLSLSFECFGFFFIPYAIHIIRRYKHNLSTLFSNSLSFYGAFFRHFEAIRLAIAHIHRCIV